MTEQVDKHRKIGLWTALTAIAIVGSTLAGAGWVAGRIYLQDEISQYKQSAKWKAPEVIERIRKLSIKLSQQLNAISDYDTLKEYKKQASKQLLQDGITRNALVTAGVIHLIVAEML